MGVVSRQGTAPIADGETSSGTEVEAEFNTLFTLVNGNIDNANVKAGANITGSKLASGSVTETQMSASTLTTASMATSAVPKFYVDVVASVGALTQSASVTDIPNVTAATLTPGSTDDFIFMDVCFDLQWAASPQTLSTLNIGWHVNGTDYAGILRTDCAADAGTTDETNRRESVCSTYAIQAPAASSMTIKPIYTTTTSAKVPTIGDLIFRCWILPGKA